MLEVLFLRLHPVPSAEQGPAHNCTMVSVPHTATQLGGGVGGDFGGNFVKGLNAPGEADVDAELGLDEGDALLGEACGKAPALGTNESYRVVMRRAGSLLAPRTILKRYIIGRRPLCWRRQP